MLKFIYIKSDENSTMNIVLFAKISGSCLTGRHELNAPKIKRGVLKSAAEFMIGITRVPIRSWRTLKNDSIHYSLISSFHLVRNSAHRQKTSLGPLSCGKLLPFVGLFCTFVWRCDFKEIKCFPVEFTAASQIKPDKVSTK